MMPMGDPGELEYGYRADALKEGWKARVGTHKYPEYPLTLGLVATSVIFIFSTRSCS
jgi:hypothetical protein